MDHVMAEVMLIGPGILANGLFAGAEIALVSARVSRLAELRQQGLQGAAASLRLREAPEAFLATIQIAITLAGTLAGAVGGVTSVEVLTPWLVHLGAGEWAAPLALAIVILVITYLALVLGELTPKAIALRDPERLACRIAPSIEWLSRATGVIVWFLTASTNAMLAAIGQHGRVSSPSVSKEEIRYLVREGVAKGLVDQVEEDLVHRALAFADTTVPEVMTPRMAVRGVDIAVPAERLLAEIAAIGYTRVPVFRGSLDQVSRPGESHPRALAEPYVNVSAHTAPIIQPLASRPEGASARRAGARDGQRRPASVRRSGDAISASCISSWPTESGARSDVPGR